MRRPGLTDRQLDVLELALRGMTNQQIGDRLYVSLDTVKTHFRHIYAQLVDEGGRAATGALHAVSLALERGWLVYDPAVRRLTRPSGRTALPSYAERDESSLAAQGERLPEQRKVELGW